MMWLTYLLQTNIISVRVGRWFGIVGVVCVITGVDWFG